MGGKPPLAEQILRLFNWWSIGLNAYHMPLRMAYSESKYYVYSFFCDDVDNHMMKSFHKIFKAWYKTKKRNLLFLDIISNFLLYYHFIHSCSYFFEQASAFCCRCCIPSRTSKILVFILKIFLDVCFYLEILFVYDCILKSLFCTFLY